MDSNLGNDTFCVQVKNVKNVLHDSQTQVTVIFKVFFNQTTSEKLIFAARFDS